MWLSNSKKYATDRFLEERASSGSVHQVVMHGMAEKKSRLPPNGILLLYGGLRYVRERSEEPLGLMRLAPTSNHSEGHRASV